MKRIYLFLFFLLIFFVFSLPPTTSAEKLKFGVPNKANPLYMLPHFAAEERGIWVQNGLAVELFPFRGGGDLHRAVAAASVNIGVDALVSLVHAAARGLPVVIVADLETVEDYFVMVPKDSPIREPLQLKGTKIGIPRFGGLVHVYGRAAARALRLEKEIKFVAAGGVAEEIAALRAGVLDAVLSSFMSMAKLLAEGELRRVLVVKDYLPQPWANLVMFARPELAQKEPQEVAKMVKAYLAAADWVSKNRDWALAKMVKEFGHSPKTAELVFSVFQYTKHGRINRRSLEIARDFLLEYGLVPKEKAPRLEQLLVPGLGI